MSAGQNARMLAERYDSVAVMRERIAFLEEEVRCLRELLAPEPTLLPELQLTRIEARLLMALVQRAPLMATSQTLHAVMYRGLPAETEEKIVHVIICKLRKKLRPRGFDVRTIWGQGYQVDAATAAALLVRQVPA